MFNLTINLRKNSQIIIKIPTNVTEVEFDVNQNSIAVNGTGI